MPHTPPVLTPRLQEIADRIIPCNCVADIGTDHAYLPVYLCMIGKAKHGIASDIRQGPVERAKATLMRYHMEALIEPRLGGGADTLVAGEADCLVIAGMGGLMISGILLENPEVFAKASQILLQPMSHIPELRRFLWENGYTVLTETLAREEGKLYHILAVRQGKEPEPMTESDLYFGRYLCKERPKHFDYYIKKQQQKLSRMAEGLKAATSPEASQRLKETLALLKTLKEELLW